MKALFAAVTGFLLVKLATLTVNLFRFPVLQGSVGAGAGSHPAAPEPPRRVSLLVPMRNEQHRLGAAMPGLLRQPAGELILLDDQSEDGTAELARQLLAAQPNARVISGRGAPAGWVGKTWACHQLAEQAVGSTLVFCDADVTLAPGALDAVLAAMRAQCADVFSVFPRQLTASLGEHLTTPLIDDVVLCFLPFGLLSVDVPAAATANGSLLAFSRGAYDELGGFAAVRECIVEDVAIARRTRSEGLKLGLALGGDLVSTRMYDGYRDVVLGLSRGLLSVAGGSRSRLVLGLGWHLLAYTLPVLLAARRRAWLLPVALGVLERGLVEHKTGRNAGWQALLTPLSPVAAVPIVAQALRARRQWKGRVYS